MKGNPRKLRIYNTLKKHGIDVPQEKMGALLSDLARALVKESLALVEPTVEEWEEINKVVHVKLKRKNIF